MVLHRHISIKWLYWYGAQEKSLLTINLFRETQYKNNQLNI